jgi:hypothetical protein
LPQNAKEQLPRGRHVLFPWGMEGTSRRERFVKAERIKGKAAATPKKK